MLACRMFSFHGCAERSKEFSKKSVNPAIEPTFKELITVLYSQTHQESMKIREIKAAIDISPASLKWQRFSSMLRFICDFS